MALLPETGGSAGRDGQSTRFGMGVTRESPFEVGDVDIGLRRELATRTGSWELRVPVLVQGSREDLVIHLKEQELVLLQVVAHARISGATMKVAGCTASQKAFELWPRGTSEHVGLRLLVPAAVACYVWGARLVDASRGRGWAKLVDIVWRSQCCALGTDLSVRLLGCAIKLLARGENPFFHLSLAGRVSAWLMGPSQSRWWFVTALNFACLAAWRIWKWTYDIETRATLRRTGPLFAEPVVAAEPTRDERPIERNEMGVARPMDETDARRMHNTHPLGGADAADMETRAATLGRSVDNGAGVGIVGLSCDERDAQPVNGVLLAPSHKEPLLYTRSQANAAMAAIKRIEEKSRPCAITDAEAANFDILVAALIKEGGAFCPKKIREWASAHCLEELKSKKWTMERFLKAIDAVYDDFEPRITPSALVKVETSTEDKAMRLLIEDQENGQILALASTACIEKLFLAHFGTCTIKEERKREAMQHVAHYHRHPGRRHDHRSTCIEGDGSAWDTTCTLRMRELLENQILAHVCHHLTTFLDVPAIWHKAHLVVNRKKKLTLKTRMRAVGRYQSTREQFKLTISSIRRSGHRATSIFNGIMNLGCWLVALYGSEVGALVNAPRPKDVTRRPEDRASQLFVYSDRWGGNRRTALSVEGDDSLVTTSPPLGPRELKDIVDLWTSWGFNMKLINATAAQRATFTGWWMDVTETGTGRHICPEVARALIGGASTSPAAIAAFKAGNKEELKKLARSYALSRAVDFAGLVPTISRQYMAYAESLLPAAACAASAHVDDVLTHEDQMRLGIEVAVKCSELVDGIELLNNGAPDEDVLLRAVDAPATPAEKDKFRAYGWSFDNLGDHSGFRAALPSAWGGA